MRIASLLPSATEILCALGLQECLVAVSHECDYPATVQQLARITRSSIQKTLSPAAIDHAVSASLRAGGALYQVDEGLMAELQPDLVVTQGLCEVCAVSEDQVQTCLLSLAAGQQSVPVLSLEATDFAGILRDIANTGRATNTSLAAERLGESLQARWQAVAALSRPTTPPRVLMLEWPEPLFAAGHWVPEQVAVAGGIEAIATPGQPSRRLSWEEVLASDPDHVVMSACGMDLAENTHHAKTLYHHPKARQLRAIQQGQLWAVDANSYFSRPGPRVVEGAEILAALVRGDSHAGLQRC